MSIDLATNSRLLAKPGKLLSALRHDIFYLLFHRKTEGLQELGDPSTGCAWTTKTDTLGPGSVIYAAGIGKDITYEHALADKTGATIHLIDPSPTAAETMKIPAHHRTQFVYHNVALTGHDGELRMGPPGNPEEGSWSSVPDEQVGGCIVVPCKSLGTMMRENGHDHVDLLKIDIEGAEYAVLEAVLASGIEVRQIAVEYHNGVLPGIPRGATISSLMKCYKAGYRIVHKGGSNHTMMLRAYL